MTPTDSTTKYATEKDGIRASNRDGRRTEGDGVEDWSLGRSLVSE